MDSSTEVGACDAELISDKCDASDSPMLESSADSEDSTIRRWFLFFGIAGSESSESNSADLVLFSLIFQFNLFLIIFLPISHCYTLRGAHNWRTGITIYGTMIKINSQNMSSSVQSPVLI